MTAYYQVVPANHLERLLWAEADRLGSLQVSQEAFASERDVVKEEFRQRVLANPYGRLQRILIPDASFATHPYKRPGIGSIEDLEAATLADVQAFHATYYRPDNANLIVIGNVDERQLNAWVDKYFAPAQAPGPALPQGDRVEPARTGVKTVTGYGPNVPLPAVALTFQAPAASSADAAALTVMDAVLSGGKSSRIYQSLVYDKQLAQAAFTYADLRQQPGLIWAYAVLASGKTLDEGEAALRAELARLRDEPVTAAELAEAKNELVYQAVSARETVDGRAFALGEALIVDGDPRKVNTEVAELQAVTAADVQRVARKYLVDDRRVVVRYLPESQRPAGEAAPAAPATAPSKPVAAKPTTVPPAVSGDASDVRRASPPPVAAPCARSCHGRRNAPCATDFG
jgi:zinc protease